MSKLPTDVELNSGALVFGRPHSDSTLPKTPPTREVPTVPKLTVESVPIPYVNRTHYVIARPVVRQPGMVANHELGGDASGYVGISLDDGVDREELFTIQTREATDELISALVRARNSAYPDADTLSTLLVPYVTLPTAESPYLADADLEPPNIAAESPYAAWRARHGIDGSVVTESEPEPHPRTQDTLEERLRRAAGWVRQGEDPEPAEQPQSEQPRREAALRRVIERELNHMWHEGI